jgi:hypothetical protein
MIKGNISIANTIKCSAVNIGFFLVIISLKMGGQPPQAHTDIYISSYAAEAVNQMIEYKIPASVTLAQAIFESACGNSNLAQRSNNHFGIKCHTQWGGDTVRKSDDSWDECFRKYNSIKDSYTDHSLFLRSRARYKELFKLSVNDYKGWCYGLKNSGYATYAYYPEVLIKIIEEYGLYEFDRAEILEPAVLICNNDKEIIKSKLTDKEFTLDEFCVNDILWNDEKYILIQSLELVIDHPEPPSIEVLESGKLMCFKTEEIIESNFITEGFTLKELSANDLLWSNERDLLIQSLEFIIDHPEKQVELITDNY